MNADQERQEFYKRFDAAVASLPAELRSRVELTSTGIDPRTGLMTLSDKFGRQLATVDEVDGKVSLVSKAATDRPASQAGASQFVTKDALVKAVQKLMKVVGERIEVAESAVLQLDDRLGSIEGEPVHKALDAEAYDTMVELAERLDRLESNLQEIADGGLRYKGYWRNGMKAKRGDAYTHDGSLWWACRDADDGPCKESPNWNIAVRKGRDGK